MPPSAPIQAKQMSNATEAFHRTREAGIEWLVHLDGDELLHATIPFRQVIENSPARADVLVFPTKEAVPQQFHYEQPFRDIELFKYGPSWHLLEGDVFRNNLQRRVRSVLTRTWRYRRKFVERIGYTHPSFLDSFLLGHTNGKAATRTSVPIRKIGNHRPKTDGERRLRVYALRRGAVLHFDCMGYDRWREKWRRRVEGAAHFNAERFRPDRKRVLQMFETAAQTGEEAVRTLYRRLYVLSPTQRILLRGLGLVERIVLSEEDFARDFLDARQNDGP